MRDPDYCSTCYGAAKKAERAVKMTDVYDHPICTLCESRFRNGLIHYIPANGTEGMMFREKCERCFHFREAGIQDASKEACTFGILDKLLNSGWSESDSSTMWYDPQDLDNSTSPAQCKRFTGKDDGDRESRRPAPKDAPRQLLFSELLTVHEPSFSDRVMVEK